MNSINLKDDWSIIPAQWPALQHPLRDIFININLMVNGELDINQVKSSLYLLIKEWPTLAARLRQNKGRNVDILTPLHFDDNIESLISFALEYREKEEISENVWNNSSSKLQQESWIIKDKTIPKSLDHYFKSGKDQPTMYVRIKQFKNVAILQVSLPHILYDILGASMILNQWSKLMIKSMDIKDIPKLVSEPNQTIEIPSYPTKNTGGKKILEEITETMNSPLRVFTKAQQFQFIANAIPEFIAHPKEKIFSIFVPVSFISKLRKESIQNGNIWISENDIVTALLFQINLFRFPKSSQLPFTLAFTFNMRGYMPGYPSVKNDPKQVWLGNSNLPAILPTFTVTEWRSKSIVEIARLIRSTILSQRTPEQMRLTCMMVRESAKRGTYPSYHPPKHKSFYCTSWEAAKFTDLLFCTKDHSTVSTVHRPGQVIRANGTSLLPNMPHRGWGEILNRQEQYCINKSNKEYNRIEGFWCTIAAREGLWPRIHAWLEETLWS